MTFCVWDKQYTCKLTTTTKQTSKNNILARTSPTSRPTWQLDILSEVKPLLFPNIFRRSYSKTNLWF